MTASVKISRFGDHPNAFGFLRLVFASLVIVAHTPEMADGDRSREILTRLCGTVSFGEVAVDGFFIISGYLIVGSFLKQPRLWPYLRKRVARIYPAFIAASLVSLLIVAPLAGATFGSLAADLGGSIKRLILLLPPSAPNVFPGTPYPGLNNATWSIAIEFRCYLLVLVLGMVGAFRRPWIIAVMAAALLGGFEWVIGSAPGHSTLRLTGIFLTGSLFYLWRDHIRFTLAGVLAAVAAVIGCMFVPKLAEVGLATAGAYLIFALAARGGSGLISRINNRDDISYGVYLYAWPIGKLLMWYWPQVPLLLADVLTFGVACLCGWLSWHGLEKPIMQRLRRRRATADSVNAATDRTSLAG